MQVWPGQPYPLGATWDGAGVNFALFSENATAVELCLFDADDPSREAHKIRLVEHTDQVLREALCLPDPDQLFGNVRSSMEYVNGELVEIGASVPSLDADPSAAPPVQH